MKLPSMLGLIPRVKPLTPSRVLTLLAVLSTLLLAAALRFHGVNWDQNHHLHPDERWLTMLAPRIGWPADLDEFISSDSRLNPKFFAYGSLPIYLLRAAGGIATQLNPRFDQYHDLALLGRRISTLFDLGTVLLVFLVGRRLKNTWLGLLAGFFYATAVFPIQNAHFYTVDTQLTFWSTLTLLLLLKLCVETRPQYRSVRDKHAASLLVSIGITFGAALATKVAAVFLLMPLLLALILNNTWARPGLIRSSLLFLRTSFLTLSVALLTAIILQPYAIIDLTRFQHDLLSQARMTRDATVFPYTIQYIGTTPYWYQLKQIVLWGLGPSLGILTVMGVTLQTGSSLRKYLQTLRLDKKNNLQSEARKQKNSSTIKERLLEAGLTGLKQPWVILLSFFWGYFLIIGASEVKFMRYMLPLYPILILAAAQVLMWLFYQTTRKKSTTGHFTTILHNNVVHLFGLSVVGSTVLYPLSFMTIYNQPHTRVAASAWINQHIPAGATLAVEHWDDSLPLFGQSRYRMVTLGLYEPDTAHKLEELTRQLNQTDYIIISSNRLYASIPRWPEKYPETIGYYEKLFNGELGFIKAAEFTSYPTLDFGVWSLEFRDEAADESFTVYDHPKVLIFEKTTPSLITL